jgi:3-oxoacyl-[acyl-carrier-protein] synthase II
VCVTMGVGLELFSMHDLVAAKRADFTLPARLEDRLSFMQTPSDLCVHLMAREHGLRALPLVHVSACAAGTDAIGAAYRLIASGRRRTMLAGGTDSMINPLGVAGFCALSATSTKNDAPARASRPFDKTRDGFVMGEGAAVLVLERLDDARARGAAVLAEISGYGASFDAHGISEPHPEGRGALQAMSRALADASLEPKDVDAVNAHGTGTPKNDPVETIALKRLLGDRAREVPISATKSMIGHLISAAGAVEAVAAVLGLRGDYVHPTINLETPDPDCDLDYVPHHARRREQRHVLSCSYGFGGHNAAIVISRSRDEGR